MNKILMYVVLLLCVVGCAQQQALPDIEATVEARLEVAKASLVAPTMFPAPTYTPLPTYTPTPPEVIVKEVIVEKEVPVEIVKEVVIEKVVEREVPIEIVVEKVVEREVPVEVVKIVEKEVIREVEVVVTASPTAVPTATPSPTPVPGTNIESQIISGDVYWDATSSPYYISGEVQIPGGSSLTIGPAVTVFYQPFASILVLGRFIAEGTASDNVIFRPINDGAQNSNPLLKSSRGGSAEEITLKFARITNFAHIVAEVGGSSVIIEDSYIENVPGRTYYLGGTFTANRNIFKDSRLVEISGGYIQLANNCFIGIPPSIFQSYSHGRFPNEIPSVIRNNSIYRVSSDSDKKLDYELEISSNPSSNSDIDLSENYWDGLSYSDIKTFVMDQTVDITRRANVNILPMAENPHPSTPDCS